MFADKHLPPKSRETCGHGRYHGEWPHCDNQRSGTAATKVTGEGERDVARSRAREIDDAEFALSFKKKLTFRSHQHKLHLMTSTSKLMGKIEHNPFRASTA
jgi:hypothetical protein